jgi:hypothetical protein
MSAGMAFEGATMAEPDMSSAAITLRLLQLRAYSSRSLAPRPVDMSPAAVERRLRTLGALYRVCVALAEIGRRAGLHGQPRG